MGHPNGASVQILDGDDAVPVYAFRPQRPVYHQVALPGRERIVGGVGVLGATDAYDEVLALGSAFPYDVHVPLVEGLEAPYDQ